ncbi:WecB/TagA/CpsF family glycosyltransferase [Streptococcus zalophi]|uniref:WecB/TagA/CpsF family glycosyltransferase n=1 Tax=Streptococcus zalophi TaxID=640031 RepID=UPI00215D55AD|nr:WecB/TagA/CpsF family glycosyltransferase [Streptococcus zalophi]MCR8967474.1 WecB/TagA/CpsF family glycosyltransferase [Streptococcus zalophi]
MLEFVKILGVKINPLTMEETLIEVEKYLSKEKPLHLMGVNADKINLCISNERIKKIVNESEIINADGASVVLASKYLGYNIPERVAGIDLMQKLLLLSERKGYSVYFLGAKEEVVLKMLERFKTLYPNLRVIGYRNGYFSDDEIEVIQEELRNLKPNIVFVGITSPKKEYLIEHFLNNGLNSVFMGVGGSFDVLSGSIKRAPLWMQKANLEWFYRVMKEPKRLFKRYFVGNVEFINHVLKEKREKNGK